MSQPPPYTLTPEEIGRYSRHLVLPEFGRAGQERLKAGSVLIVGVGGLGSPAALYLAAAGVGRIGLLDDDRVALSNLQRQIVHGQATVGLAKVASAAARLHDLNPFAVIEQHALRLTSSNALDLLAGYDLILDGSDNFPSRYLINDACVRLGKPLIYGSVLRFEGQLAVFHTPHSPCYRCVFPQPPSPDQVHNCAEAGVLGVLPGIIGTLQATEAIKLLTGIGTPLTGKLLLYDALALSFTPITLRKHPQCPVCTLPPDQVELDDYEAWCGLSSHDRAGEAQSAEPTTMYQISASELKQRLDGEDRPFVLDVRDPDEWAICALDDAVKIPLPTVQLAAYDILSGQRRIEDTALAQLPRDRDIVVHCHAGVRSEYAILMLRELGFAAERLLNLDGGITAWAMQVDPTMPIY